MLPLSPLPCFVPLPYDGEDDGLELGDEDGMSEGLDEEFMLDSSDGVKVVVGTAVELLDLLMGSQTVADLLMEHW